MDFLTQLFKTSPTVRVVAGVLVLAVCLAISVAEPGSSSPAGGVRQPLSGQSPVGSGVDDAIDKVGGVANAATSVATEVAKQGAGVVSETLSKANGVVR